MGLFSKIGNIPYIKPLVVLAASFIQGHAAEKDEAPNKEPEKPSLVKVLDNLENEEAGEVERSDNSAAASEKPEFIYIGSLEQMSVMAKTYIDNVNYPAPNISSVSPELNEKLSAAVEATNRQLDLFINALVRGADIKILRDQKKYLDQRVDNERVLTAHAMPLISKDPLKKKLLEEEDQYLNRIVKDSNNLMRELEKIHKTDKRPFSINEKPEGIAKGLANEMAAAGKSAGGLKSSDTNEVTVPASITAAIKKAVDNTKQV